MMIIAIIRTMVMIKIKSTIITIVTIIKPERRPSGVLRRPFGVSVRAREGELSCSKCDGIFGFFFHDE